MLSMVISVLVTLFNHRMINYLENVMFLSISNMSDNTHRLCEDVLVLAHV